MHAAKGVIPLIIEEIRGGELKEMHAIMFKPKRILQTFLPGTAVCMESEKFTQFFTIEFRKEEKIKLYPFKLKSTITDLMGVKPLEITSGQQGFSVWVTNKK